VSHSGIDRDQTRGCRTQLTGVKAGQDGACKVAGVTLAEGIAMSIKSILTVFGGNEHELNAVETGLSLGQTCRGLVRILHVAAPPVLTEFSGLSLYGAVAYLDASTIDALDEAEAALAVRAGGLARTACTHAGAVLHPDGSDIVMGQFQASFRLVTGDIRRRVAEQGAFADLIVTGYDNRPDGDLDVILAGLFDAGRPVLAMPRHPAAVMPATGFARTVALAWDGSLTSARAVREAVPHMLHAQTVHVIHVTAAGEEADEGARRDLMTYLRSHCIAADYRAVAPGGQGVGGTLLAEARNARADLLIMGAYGRGHISEMLLGGVTDHVLKHADRPLLLVH